MDLAWHGEIAEQNPAVYAVIDAAGVAHGASMKSYLIMMAVRLLEMHRLLKPTGSLYLHCDPTASHYLKLLLDAVFGSGNFRSEIVWKRTSGHSDAHRQFAGQTDTLLFYATSDQSTFNVQHAAYSEKYIKSHYSTIDADGRAYTTRDLRSPHPRPNLTYDYKGYKPHPNGWSVSVERMTELDAVGLLSFPPSKDGRIRIKRYLDEMPGTRVGNLWDNISPINSQAQERVGYPTQKPLALLDRIVSASSNPGDVVLDPFAGCATACVSAETLGRQWIGIDLSPLAATLVKTRLREAFKLFYDVHHRDDVPRRTDLGPLPNYRTHRHTLFGKQEDAAAAAVSRFRFGTSPWITSCRRVRAVPITSRICNCSAGPATPRRVRAPRRHSSRHSRDRLEAHHEETGSGETEARSSSHAPDAGLDPGHAREHRTGRFTQPGRTSGRMEVSQGRAQSQCHS